MKNNSNIWFALLRLFVIPAFLLGATESVSAYVIPAWKIVQMAQEKNLPVQNLRVSRRTSLFDPVFPEGKVDIHEELYLDAVKGFRIEMKTPSGNTMFVDDGRTSITVLNNRIITEGALHGSVFQLFFSRREQDDILMALKRMGINASVVSLGRMSGRVVIIIGAEPGDLSRIQIWVDKKLLLPVRFIGPDHLYRDGSFVARNFSDHFQMDGALWFPKIVRSFVGGTLVRTSVVLRAQTNISMPQDFFSISQIRETMPYGEQKEAKNALASSTDHVDSNSFPIPEPQGEAPVDVDKLFNNFKSILKRPKGYIPPLP